MIYVMIDNNNIISAVTTKKVIYFTGDCKVAEVDSLPSYDKETQRLKATNITPRTESYEVNVETCDDNGEVVITKETKTREYLTCDLVVIDIPSLKAKREILELEQWFAKIYDPQVKQYQRSRRLGIPYDNKYGTIQELDNKAKINADRLTYLRGI